MSGSNGQPENRPAEFHKLVGAPRHRIFVIFDHPADGEEAVSAITSRNLARDDAIWKFYGSEGSHRLDPSGAEHGLHGRLVRFIQWLMSDDQEYLQALTKAVETGGLVLAVRAEGDAEVHEIAEVLRAHSGYAIRYCRHLDYNEL